MNAAQVKATLWDRLLGAARNFGAADDAKDLLEQEAQRERALLDLAGIIIRLEENYQNGWSSVSLGRPTWRKLVDLAKRGTR